MTQKSPHEPNTFRAVRELHIVPTQPESTVVGDFQSNVETHPEPQQIGKLNACFIFCKFRTPIIIYNLIYDSTRNPGRQVARFFHNATSRPTRDALDFFTRILMADGTYVCKNRI